jgi:5-methylcytosine-specific restriction protein A
MAQRKLAAILSADVAGFTALMERDELGTLERLKRTFAGVFEPRVAAHGGRVVKFMGDGALCEFVSVVAAVRCALEVQAAMAEAEADESQGEKLVFRIGVNLGDVIIEGEDIFGDGVNVAARLQALAAPGGVALSRTVREHVAGKIDTEFDDLGEHRVKNKRQPVHVFAFGGTRDEINPALSELRPKRRELVIDLVARAGIDVSDWSSGARGAAGASTNPKYCYEWAFVAPRNAVVLNLWHGEFEDDGDDIVQRGNLREDARFHSENGGKPNWIARARRFDRALQQAVELGLPVRVIVNDGQRRPKDDPTAKASSVAARELDAMLWAVTSYNWDTGAFVLTRGAAAPRFIDQFSLMARAGADAPKRASRASLAFERSFSVRQAALTAAKGHCEHCGAPGFLMSCGSVYLETHHIVPLSEGGRDGVENVVALCPNHHREAHFGASAAAMRAKFLALRQSGAPWDVSRG